MLLRSHDFNYHRKKDLRYLNLRYLNTITPRLHIKGRVVLNFLAQNTTLCRSCTAVVDKFYFLVENTYFPWHSFIRGVLLSLLSPEKSL